MVVDRSNTPSSTPTSPRRLARALTAAAASGALLVSGAGTALAAPGNGGPAAGSEAGCLVASFPSDQTRTTAAAVDEWLACTGLSDGAAYADPGITRGEAAQIAYRSVGADEPAAASVFTDVAPGSASAAAINWLAAAGVVRGFGDGEFKPERDITRDQLAKVLVGTALTGAAVPAAGTGAEGAGADETATGAPAPTAGVGTSAATAYERDAAGFMAQYGCEGTALDIVETTSMPGATGVTTVTTGAPATVQILAGMDPYMLEHTAAHECMHVLQHEVSGYSPEAAEAMLEPYYAADYASSWGTVDVFEQNAECALRGLGFPQEHSNYDVACDETMLQAGQAIASGQDPRQVVPAG